MSAVPQTNVGELPISSWIGGPSITDARIVLGSGISDRLAHRLIVQGIPRLVVGGRIPKLKPQFAEP